MSTRFPISRKFAPSWQHHIARYAFALSYCYRKSVLDAGCQIGFGGNILSYVANSVTFADMNKKYTDFASSMKNMCPTSYVVVDFEKTFPVGSWDTIVSFEVIEHLENPELFLENISKALNPNGKFVFSVPKKVANHEHKHLYDENKIKELVSRFLNIEEFYIQDKNIITGGPLYGNLTCFVGVAVKK